MRRTNQVKTLIAHQNLAAILMQLVGVYFNGQENGRLFLFHVVAVLPSQLLHDGMEESNEQGMFTLENSNLIPWAKGYSNQIPRGYAPRGF